MKNNNSLKLLTSLMFLICSVLNWIKYSNSSNIIDFVAAIVWSFAFLAFFYGYFKVLKQKNQRKDFLQS